MVAEVMPRGAGEHDVINANSYIAHMLAVSLGLKLFDAIRRILMYTKSQHKSKAFYAFCRGVFPIQEACGIMTALALAKRDLLGFPLPAWRILLPSILFHSTANYRGMKPFFKWNSATPWLEMQMLPPGTLSAVSLPDLLKKGYGKLMWFVVVSRVVGNCIKEYYLVNRRAVKRTTMYANNHSAFSAEVATTEVLKTTMTK
jgi:hypothetical protein